MFDAGKRIGYRGDPTAQSLRPGRTGILALVLPMIGTDAHRNEALGLDFYISSRRRRRCRRSPAAA
jgi:DNA-binding LacI/PurR family transcriptional regulator